MKIALFDYLFEPDKPGITGLSDLVWTWAKHLVAFGHEVHIVAPYPESTQAPEGAIIHRFPLPMLGYRNVIGHLLIAWRGWQVIRKIENLDIVQAPEYLSTGVFTVYNPQKLPIVMKVPGNIYERIENGNPFDWSMTAVLKVTAKRSAKGCAKVIVTSEDMRYWWGKTGTPEQNMVLIADGVDAERFYRIPDAREQLGWSSNKKIILYAGRLSHEKGVHHLVDAFPTIANIIPNVELRIVGSGPAQAELKAKAEKIGDGIVFENWVAQPNLPLYYNACDAFVLPSYSEGLPRVMMEAMACGTLFVGTRISGITDHIIHEANGLLIEAGDSEGLAQALIDVMTHVDKAQSIADNGYLYAQEYFSSEQAVRKFCDAVYAPILNQTSLFYKMPEQI